MDGINAALVDFSTTKPRLLASRNTPYPKDITDQLNQIIKPSWRGSLSELLSIDCKVGRAFARASCDLIEDSGITAESINAIGHHGQTVWHQPESETPSSLQLGDPNIIAEITGITVVADWRRRDIAAGGQGAPLAPAFHIYCFGDDKNKAVLNLGGIANLTILCNQTGFDTGPANTLLDTWIRHCQGKDYDKDGQWARKGTIDQQLLNSFLQDPYFQQLPPKSTGREKLNLEWIEKTIANTVYKNEDVQATLTELTAKTISQALATNASATSCVILCGGGTHNQFLVERLEQNAKHISFKSSAEYGLDPDTIEAMAFAWLAQQTLAGKPGNIPSVTGATGSRVLGCIYPV